MTTFTKIGTSLALAAGLALSSGASIASAAAPAGGWSLTRSNTAGTYYAVMSSSTATFCFLTGVKVEETDTGGEYARCQILEQNGRWVLEAGLGANSDADVSCQARCYTNN